MTTPVQLISFSMLLLLIVLTLSSVQGEGTFNSYKDVTQFMEQQLGSQVNFSVITGYLPIDWYFPDNNETGIFYEMTTKFGEFLNNTSNSTPIIAWFQGGPGAPSQFGSWCEIGPFTVVNNQSITFRNNSWSNQGILLFIDQPLQVGGSWTSTNYQVNNTEDASKMIVNFFENFFKTFPFLAKNPLYLVGESYAGHYIPQIGFDMFNSDKFNISAINFQGVAIGDGLTDAAQQLISYASYSFSAGVISQSEYDLLTQRQIVFSQMMQQRQFASGMNYSQFQIQDQIVSVSLINLQNFMQYSTPPPYPSWFNNWRPWLIANRDEYGIALQVPESQITGNGQMFDLFTNSGDIGKSFKSQVEYLLNKTQVLLYNGQLDVLVNTPGVESMINSFSWSNIWQWKQSKKYLLTLNGGTTVVGNFKQSENFTFAVVYGAGHLVPTDQPAAALQMIDNFINRNWTQI